MGSKYSWQNHESKFPKIGEWHKFLYPIYWITPKLDKYKGSHTRDTVVKLLKTKIKSKLESREKNRQITYTKIKMQLVNE